MRQLTFAVAVVLATLGCQSKHATPSAQPETQVTPGSAERPTVPLTDLTAASTLAPMRAAFNANKGKARFLTLLSPT
jgi:hypothetical protein